MNLKTGFDLQQLVALSRQKPEYASMLNGLYQIDKVIKKFVTDEIENLSSNPDEYFIKTELMNKCYNIYLYSSARQAIVGTSWPLADFLVKCEDKSIERDIKDRTKRMLDKFGGKLIVGGRTNWII